MLERYVWFLWWYEKKKRKIWGLFVLVIFCVMIMLWLGKFIVERIDLGLYFRGSVYNLG